MRAGPIGERAWAPRLRSVAFAHRFQRGCAVRLGAYHVAGRHDDAGIFRVREGRWDSVGLLAGILEGSVVALAVLEPDQVFSTASGVRPEAQQGHQ